MLLSAGMECEAALGQVRSETQRSRLSVWAEAAQRAFMWRYLASRLSLVLVTEYPKSGGTWAAQMISDYTGLPFPRNCAPRLEPCILHGHRAFDPAFRNVCCVLRDGRDVMVSAYYHMLFENEKNDHRFVRANRLKLAFDDFEDIEANLPGFIEFLFTQRTNVFYNFTWSEFVRGWHGRDAIFIRYERLLMDPLEEMGSALKKLTGETVDSERLQDSIEKFSFSKVSDRNPGDENVNSFIRKGVSGDWKNKFSPEARRTFDRFGGAELVLLGYEPDRRWVEVDDR